MSGSCEKKNDQIRMQFIELQKRTVELENSNKELEQFAYVASHDLQEPLRTITNYMAVFEEDYLDKLDDNAVKYLHSVSHATNRMRMLIKSLLNFSILSHNVEFTETDVKILIEDVLDDIRILINTANAKITVGLMPVLNVYEPLIRKVFQNLITNAVKFQKKDAVPVIMITSAQTDTDWEFCVADNGIGIAPEHYERVFNIFQRLHNNEEEYAGNGIGLANCKKIIQLHHGEIWIEPNENQGTKFYFTIPIPIV
jgi:light-regulated signal transduction histidine kinase (bacteriophytochrome)